MEFNKSQLQLLLCIFKFLFVVMQLRSPKVKDTSYGGSRRFCGGVDFYVIQNLQRSHLVSLPIIQSILFLFFFFIPITTSVDLLNHLQWIRTLKNHRMLVKLYTFTILPSLSW